MKKTNGPVLFLLIIYMLAGQSCSPSPEASPSVHPENKITDIRYKDVFDLSGGSGNPYSLFDEQGVADPEHGIKPDCSTGDRADANKMIYFPATMQRQWRSGADLRGNYHLKKIWYYIGGYNPYYGDSLFFYKTTDFVTVTEIAKVSVPRGVNGWHSLDLNDTSHYIITGLKRSRNDLYKSYGTVELKETIFYGDLIGEREAAPLNTYDVGKQRPTIDNIIGINIIGGYELMSKFQPYKNIRIMTDASWVMDTAFLKSFDEGGYNNIRFNLDHFREYRSGAPERALHKMVDSFNLTGHYVTISMSAGSEKLRQRYNFNGPRLDDTLGNYYSPASYRESGRLFWTLGAIFGSVKYDTGKIPILNVPKNGISTMNYNIKNKYANNVNISNGNEVNGNWKADDTTKGNEGFFGVIRYQNNLSLVAQSQTDYDGWEGRLGDTVGIANADPANRLSSSSLFQIDSMLPQSLVILSKAMRKDRKNIFGRLQFNSYPVKDGHGVHPVEFNYASKVRNFVNYLKTVDTTWEVEYTEAGYDANTNSVQSTPLRTGNAWTDREWQAICNAYLFYSIAGSGVDRFYFYCAVTNMTDDNGSSFATCGAFASWFGKRVDIRYPTWYYSANMVRLLKGYYEDSIMSYTWNGKVLIKYRNREHPDSVAYVIGHASKDGTILSNQTIPVGKIQGGAVLHDLSFTAETTHTTILAPSKGIITVPSVTEKPMIMLVKEMNTLPHK